MLFILFLSLVSAGSFDDLCSTDETACTSDATCNNILTNFNTQTSGQTFATTALALAFAAKAEYIANKAITNSYTANHLFRRALECDAIVNLVSDELAQAVTQYDLYASCYSDPACAPFMGGYVGYLGSLGIPITNGMPYVPASPADYCGLYFIATDANFAPQESRIMAAVAAQIHAAGGDLSLCWASVTTSLFPTTTAGVAPNHDCSKVLESCYGTTVCKTAWETALGGWTAADGAAGMTKTQTVTVAAASVTAQTLDFTTLKEPQMCFLMGQLLMQTNPQAMGLGFCYQAEAGYDNSKCAAENGPINHCLSVLVPCVMNANCNKKFVDIMTAVAGEGVPQEHVGFGLKATVMRDGAYGVSVANRNPNKDDICTTAAEMAKVKDFQLGMAASLCMLDAYGFNYKYCYDEISDEIAGIIMLAIVFIIVGTILSLLITACIMKSGCCDCCANHARKNTGVAHEN